MSQRTADPARTHALLVAVEKYAAPWDLNGPLGDVLAYHSWLRARGVPAAQIHTLASPLDSNLALAEKAGVAISPATSAGVHEALGKLRQTQGDLLFVIWAGHGVVNTKQHCLFVADANIDHKRNFSLDTLRESLASTYFAGFPLQIFIVDACANYQDWDFSVPSEPVPSGVPILPPREQFVFVAAQPGEVATNSEAESRGLFSRELLRQLLDAKGSNWPPDMRGVAEGVQSVFAGLRRSNKATQTPVWEWIRDWEGNSVELSTAADPGSVGEAPSASWELNFRQKTGLTDALLACRAMSFPQARDDLVEQLSTEIRARVRRQLDQKGDVMNILQTAAQFPGGLEELLVVVRYMEGPTISWQALERVVAQHLPKLKIDPEVAR